MPGEALEYGSQTKYNIAKLNNTNGSADGTWNPNASGTVWSIAVSGSDIYTGESLQVSAVRQGTILPN